MNAQPLNGAGSRRLGRSVALVGLLATGLALAGCGEQPANAGDGSLAGAVEQLVADGQGTLIVEEPGSGQVVELALGPEQKLTLRVPGGLSRDEDLNASELFSNLGGRGDARQGYEAVLDDGVAAAPAQVTRMVFRDVYALPEDADLVIESQQ